MKKTTKVFNTDFKSPGFFLKQIIGGAFITVGMTGLDQEMMQKNICVATLGGLAEEYDHVQFLTGMVISCSFCWVDCCAFMRLPLVLTRKGDDLFPTIAVKAGFRL